MKKIISMTQENLFDMVKNIFNCSVGAYTEVKKIQDEEILFDYVKLSPKTEDFHDVVKNVSNIINVDEIDILITDKKEILIDYIYISEILEKAYQVTCTGWYDVDYCEALGNAKFLVFFEIL